MQTSFLTSTGAIVSHLARRTDPVTSHMAAASVKHFAGEHHKLILGSLGLHGPQTALQISEATGLDYWQVNRRIGELVEAKSAYVYSETGGKSPKGRPCRVYAATDWKDVA